MLRVKIKKFIDGFRGFIFNEKSALDTIYLVLPDSPQKAEIETEIRRRFKYFGIDLNIKVVPSISFLQHFNFSLVSFNKSGRLLDKLSILKKDETYNFDYTTNYMDAWDYHRLLRKLNKAQNEQGMAAGKAKLTSLKQTLSTQLKKAYIFGTGPSLEKAINNDWTDGIRIVSNTIVKDNELWQHLNPHFIVAGDAIYHFGTGKFAESFRADLKDRLKETNTHFAFPAMFYSFCLKEFGTEFHDRLIPIPIGHIKTVNHDLTQQYYLSAYGNVLPLILLPLACTFARYIGFWGFDGRAPDDKMFWKNSSKHFYSEYVPELTQLHPAFFETLVPKGKQDSYVKKVHGDDLDNAMIAAEGQGFKFEMLHFSYTPVFQKRYKGVD